MAVLFVLACLLSIPFFCNCSINQTYVLRDHTTPYEVGHFNQYIDHFNEMSYGDRTFKQKFLYNVQHWKAGVGPIFFYTGNEGPIEAFWRASGFIHELAAEMEALVIFAEHRFYGSSLPFGQESFKRPYLGLLTIDQALADYAVLIRTIVEANKSTKCKVITFGGSYGGMLAAYMRFIHPNIVHGSLASSAPIYMLDPNFDRNFFFSKVTKDFKDVDSLCQSLTVRVFNVIKMMVQDKAKGYKAISRYFGLCDEIKDDQQYDRFLGWMRNGFVMLSMLNYPYPTDFEGHLPAFPIKAACLELTTAHNPLYGLANLLGVYYNGTKSLRCFNITDEYIPCADPTGCGVGPDAIAWDFQACTEVSLPEGSDGIHDMFINPAFTDMMRVEYCLKKYGVLPRHDWPSIQFWGEEIKSSSNIIFSNGDLDPWRGGGVLKDISRSIVAINVIGGAHHLDLRAPNKADPPGVTMARERERKIIRQWINSKSP